MKIQKSHFILMLLALSLLWVIFHMGRADKYHSVDISCSDLVEMVNAATLEFYQSFPFLKEMILMDGVSIIIDRSHAGRFWVEDKSQVYIDSVSNHAARENIFNDVEISKKLVLGFVGNKKLPTNISECNRVVIVDKIDYDNESVYGDNIFIVSGFTCVMIDDVEIAMVFINHNSPMNRFSVGGNIIYLRKESGLWSVFGFDTVFSRN